MRQLIGNECQVIAVVVIGLLLGEAGIRIGDKWMSIDLRHLQSFEKLSRRFDDRGPNDDLQVLFLGNSTTRCGIDPAVFLSHADDHSRRKLSITKIHPDATKIADWYYLYRNFFHEKGRKPDLMIIGFEGDQLADQPTQHINRLAQFYDCGPEDWQALTRWDLRTFEDVCSFSLSGVSGLYGNRDRFDRRVLDLVIPHYREAVVRINSAQRIAASSTSSRKMTQPTYERLEEFLKTVRADGTRTVFAAMPLGYSYEIEPAARTLLAAHGAELVDCRDIPEMTPEMIPDGIHLSPAGAVCYSEYLARALPWSRLLPGASQAVSGGDSAEPSDVWLAREGRTAASRLR